MFQLLNHDDCERSAHGNLILGFLPLQIDIQNASLTPVQLILWIMAGSKFNKVMLNIQRYIVQSKSGWTKIGSHFLRKEVLLIHMQHHDLVSTSFRITGDTMSYVCDSLWSEFKLLYGDSGQDEAGGSVTFRETALPCSGAKIDSPDLGAKSVGRFATSIESKKWKNHYKTSTTNELLVSYRYRLGLEELPASWKSWV